MARLSLLLFALFSLIFFSACGSGGTSAQDDEGTITDEENIVPGDTDKKPLPDSGIDSEGIINSETDTPNTDGKGDIDEKPDEDVDKVTAKDQDGDGIPDSIECPDTANCPDTDKDGIPDYLDKDSDGDGIPDSLEAGADPLHPVDTNQNGTPDYLDGDSDGDGIPDSVEAGADPENPIDTDGNSIPDYRSSDSDGDGIKDSVEAGADPLNPVDTDKDGTPDFIDIDADGDGILDKFEGVSDPDGDGIPNYLDNDSDGDGWLDSEEAGMGDKPLDSDGDGIPNFLDGDSDNDGLSDKDELKYGTDLTNPDTDGDGMDDMAEIAYGSNPLDKTSKIKDGDFYVVLPYQEPEKKDALEFKTDLKAADIMIMIDLSNSMSEEIAILKTKMTQVITDIKTAIPDTQFGLISFGTWTDSPYTVNQIITSDTASVQTAINTLAIKTGYYEAHEEVLYQAATGAGLTSQIRFKYVRGSASYTVTDVQIPAITGCGADTRGGACFRKSALPMFIMVTDEGFQGYDLSTISDDSYYTGGISGQWWPAGTTTKGHSLTEAIAAMETINAKFIGINSKGDELAGSPWSNYTTTSIGTDSKSVSGTYFNYTINPDGTMPGGGDLSQKIVDAVTDLSKTVAMVVTTDKESVTNSESVDTKEFIRDVIFNSADPSAGASIDSNNKLWVDPGTKVLFDVKFKNDIYENKAPEAKLFKAKIHVLGEGSLLDTRDVFIIVPGVIPNSGQQ